MSEMKSSGNAQRGLFVTFEGGEGVGKSTQIALLAGELAGRGMAIHTTREPGGSAGAEAVRHVLLSGAAEPLGADMEAMLFSAARADHVDNVIRPMLEAGTTVLCDRFIDSTRVYQGITGGAPMSLLSRLERIACGDCWPDLTIILDLDPKQGLKRAAARRGGDTPDRFEKGALEMQRKRRQAFLDIAEAEPGRCVVVPAAGSPQDVQEAVRAHFLRVQSAKRPQATGAGASHGAVA